MVEMFQHTPTILTREHVTAALRTGHVKALFQPIEDLQTGLCARFEALARLSHDGRDFAPDSFLGGFDDDDRLCLFGAMLGQGIALMKGRGSRGRRQARDPGPALRSTEATAGLTVSINVEISLIVSDDFVDVLRYMLDRHGFAGERIVLEILENEDVSDAGALKARLDTVRGLGLSIALDDIGSAYASLVKIKMLPVDIIKLDRSFTRDLEQHPEDLVFVMSVLSLARGLGKTLVVEGIETLEAYDALRMMGVQYGQGHGIAPPMPAEAVAGWLASRHSREASRVPRCLLGAYAAHLTVIESCRALRSQPLPVQWIGGAADDLSCVIGQLFTARGWHDTPFGVAHTAFHDVLPQHRSEPERWDRAAAEFRAAMAEAIALRPGEVGCEAVPARQRALKPCGCLPATGRRALKPCSCVPGTGRPASGSAPQRREG